MTGSEEYNRILRVESYVKKVAGAFRPKVAVVLGSGLRLEAQIWKSWENAFQI